METFKGNNKTEYNHANEGGDVNTCVNIKTGNGQPVKEVDQEGHAEVIKYLLKHGKDIKDSDGPRSFNATQWEFYFEHCEDYLNFY